MLYTKLAAINSFICARLCPSKYRATFSLYFRIVQWNTVMAVRSKKARRERSWFTLQFEVTEPRGKSETIVSWSESLWRPIYRSKATRMDGWSLYSQNEHKRIFIILWQLASHKILIMGFSFPIWCRLYIRAVPNECKKLVPFPFFIDF